MGKEQKYIAAARCGFNLPKHGKSEHFRRENKHDFDTLCVPRQHAGEPGIGGTCGAERGKLRHWGRWGYYGFTMSEETKKESLFQALFS